VPLHAALGGFENYFMVLRQHSLDRGKVLLVLIVANRSAWDFDIAGIVS